VEKACMFDDTDEAAYPIELEGEARGKDRSI
jgi:hypothetical protein